MRKWMDVFGQISMCASVLMIVALTFERHFAIRSPHRVSICTLKILAQPIVCVTKSAIG